MSGVIDVGARAAVSLFETAAGRWFGGAIAVGLLSVLSAMIIAGPRV
jgi:APA family basic amino acid/polyamine antiporter